MAGRVSRNGWRREKSIPSPSADRAPSRRKVALPLELQGALEIGGVVRRARLIEIIMDQAGVVDVELTAPAANVAVADDAIAVLVPGLAWVEG